MKRRRLSKRKRIRLIVKRDKKMLDKGPLRPQTNIQLLASFDVGYLCSCLSDVAKERIHADDTFMTVDRLNTLLTKVRHKLENELNEKLKYDFDFWSECLQSIDEGKQKQ